MNFSYVGDYIENLYQLAEFWQERAEYYFGELDNKGVEFDEDGLVKD